MPAQQQIQHARPHPRDSQPASAPTVSRKIRRLLAGSPVTYRGKRFHP